MGIPWSRERKVCYDTATMGGERFGRALIGPAGLRRRLGLFGLLLGLLASLCGPQSGLRPAGAQPAPAPVPSPPGLPHTFQLFQELAARRGVSLQAPVRVLVQDRAAVDQHLRELLDRQFPPDQARAEQKMLAAMGLLPAGFDLRAFVFDLLREQVAAYYDPHRREVVLGDWLTNDQMEAALRHELAHALQDQQLNLRQFLAPMPGRSDLALARESLLEGEAMVLMLEGALAARGADLAQLPALGPILEQTLLSSMTPVLRAGPPFFRARLFFPYVAGAEFIQTLRRQEPWSALMRLYRDPPRATAQILDPEQYRQGVAPEPIVLPEVSGLLGAGWSRVHEDVVGAFHLLQVLRLAHPEPEARRLVTGLRGDRVALLEQGSAESLLIWLTVWENEGTAGRFVTAAGPLLPPLRPGAVELSGPAPQPGPAPQRTWRLPQGLALVEQRGPEVLMLLGAPAASVDPLRRLVWGARGR